MRRILVRVLVLGFLAATALAQGGAQRVCEDCLRGTACVNGKCVGKPEAAIVAPAARTVGPPTTQASGDATAPASGSGSGSGSGMSNQPAGYACAADNDCMAGLKCVSGKCAAAKKMKVGPITTSLVGRLNGACRTDGTCNDQDLVCDKAKNRCVAAGGNGQPCRSDSSCGPALMCTQGTCLSPRAIPRK